METNSKPSILAVDDDPVILNSILSILKNEYNVTPLRAGESALKYLSIKSTDLILVDAQMPGLTGYDLLEKIKGDSSTSDIPVIFLTGSINGDDEIKAFEMGASDYILKPIKPIVLLARVGMHIELQNYRKNRNKNT